MYTKKNVTLYDTEKYVAILGEVDGVSARELHVTGNELKIGDESITSQDIANLLSSDIIVDTSSDDWNNTYSSVFTNSANWDRTYTLSTQFSSTWDVIYDVVDDVSIMSNASAYWDMVYNKHTGWDQTSEVVTQVIGLTGDWDDTRTTVQDYSASWEESADINVVSADVSVLKQDRVDWDQNVSTTAGNSGYWNDTYLSVLSTSATWDNVYSYVQSSSGLYGLATLGSDGKLDENLVPNLSITDTFVVTYVAAVQELCAGTSTHGDVNIKRGDVVVVAGGNNLSLIHI